jgi:hypothetical protein
LFAAVEALGFAVAALICVSEDIASRATKKRHHSEFKMFWKKAQ